MYSNLDVSIFADLFKGNPAAYGVTVVNPDDVRADGKVGSVSKLIYDEVTPAVLSRHLEGTQSVGLSPLLEDDTCYFGAIDLDSYKYTLMDIVRAVYEFNLPLCPFYSKSHHLHLYAFFSDPARAEDVQELLRAYLMLFALPKNTEVFPKQARTTTSNKFYSWINLPYYEANNEDNCRKLIDSEGRLVSLSEALVVMQDRRLTLKEHWDAVKDLPFYSAPPCISAGLLLHDVGPGQRNNWLFSVGVFYRLQDEHADLDTLLTEANNSLHDPIPEAELRNTVLAGFQRKSYFYGCASMERCEKGYCRKKEHGIESKASTGLEYGDMTQYMTDPPYYEWIVNGQKLQFTSELEIIQQLKFKALCMRQLHLVPRHVKDDAWSAILTRALSNVTVVQPETLTGDFGSGSTFTDLTYAFFQTSRRADNITQLSLGRVYEDPMEHEYVFTARTFMDFLTVKNNFRDYKPMEIRNKLVDLGAYKAGNVWRIDVNAIPAKPEIDIEFTSKYQRQGGDSDVNF